MSLSSIIKQIKNGFLEKAAGSAHNLNNGTSVFHGHRLRILAHKSAVDIQISSPKILERCYSKIKS